MDETQPLLVPVPPLTITAGQHAYIADVNIAHDDSFDHRIDFNPNGDPENPLEWPKAYHNGVISLLACMAFTVTFTCIGVVPIARQIILDLEHQESKTASVLLVTIWELGEAAGPLLIAPLSEVYGRAAVFNVANILFILWTVVAACSQTSHLFILSRFMTGCAVASNVLNPAVIGDMLPPDKRGSAMATLMAAPLIGGALGPAITGAIAESIGWRSVLWFAAGMAGICEIAFVFLLRETYKTRIIQRRIARLEKNNVDLALKAAIEEETEPTMVAIWKALKRPAVVFGGSFVLQILSFYGAILFTFYYVLATTLPELLKTAYGFAPAQIGYSFFAFSVGSIIGILICKMLVNRLYVYLRSRNNNKSHPEYQLPLTAISALILPISITLFGWTAVNGWPVEILLFLVGIQGLALLAGSVPLMAYVVDAFGLYSASALTAVLITRCLMSTFLPLLVGPLNDAVGHGWGFTIVAGVCLAVAPIPSLVMRYGEKWRQWSTYTRDD